MKSFCIACGDELAPIICTGMINGMEVTFCVDDAKSCMNCENIRCRLVER